MKNYLRFIRKLAIYYIAAVAILLAVMLIIELAQLIKG